MEGDPLSQQKRNTQLRRRYGISLWHYQRMLEDQGGTCAICNTPPRSHRSLAVDHDHATGAVRALLCDPCNKILGHLRDRPEHALGLLLYLLEHQPKNDECHPE